MATAQTGGKDLKLSTATQQIHVAQNIDHGTQYDDKLGFLMQPSSTAFYARNRSPRIVFLQKYRYRCTVNS